MNPDATPVAVLIGGPPATGKTTLARALAPRLPAALLDIDVVTGPLTTLVLRLIGASDPSETRAAELTRDARYASLLAVAADVAHGGVSSVVVAPFSRERHEPGWASVDAYLGALARVRLVWLSADAEVMADRLRSRGSARDAVKLLDPAGYTAGLDTAPPSVTHLALDAGRAVLTLVDEVLAYLEAQ